MSVILVKKEKNKIIIGSDSQESSISGLKQNNINSKLRKVEEDVYIACAGDAHTGSILFAYAEENSLVNVSKSMDLINYFSRFNIWVYENILIDEPEKIPSVLQNAQFILIIKNRIWYFADFYVRELSENEFSAIGSGSQAALACMELGKNIKIKQALEATCKVDSYCSQPIKLIEINI